MVFLFFLNCSISYSSYRLELKTNKHSNTIRSFKKIKQFWNVPDHINLLLRDVALEPKRVQSIFRERVEKHKNGMSLLHLCFNENIRMFCFVFLNLWR